jgi:sec-independent protein translocase protein TatA
MGNIGLTEFLLIALAVFMFFGSRRIPELARGLGKAVREFRSAAKGDTESGVERKG